jgi:hypothetical protein
MSVAVSCNISDGVVLGVDSAAALPAPGGFLKIYENAEKLFQLGSLPVGVAIFGLAGLGTRSVGSYLREFEIKKEDVIANYKLVSELVEALREFFVLKYQELVVPIVERAQGKLFDQIPLESRPALGLVVGGFSKGEYLSEVWSILVPFHERAGSAQRYRAQGDFGTNWFALFQPIQRYVKGYDLALMQDLLQYFEKLRGGALSSEESSQVEAILQRHEFQIPFAAMPMVEGIEHTRFLVNLVIQHHRFAVGAPVVGGKTKIGLVTCRGEKFRFLDE